jgi:N-acetylglutamate synthase-like GNAT family acetyltransferase
MNDSRVMSIRRATAQDVDALSALALSAKAHWGYTHAQLSAWRGVLEQSVEKVKARPVFVCELDGRMAGFYALLPGEAVWELDDLWVAPSCMHRGVGRALIAHARRTAAAAGTDQRHGCRPRGDPGGRLRLRTGAAQRRPVGHRQRA